ncbi:carotenoid cleavage dioxygenase [Patellaria atrata CBS 101060]|uniref:Carotenoid cleavage dioxygenase n=1 Tax=Patellaria atrata CBS 101060 TaxID=1346257 RepID=A0A9P4VTZ7_9PEZI|nr:carotenoid cleavage dioxygenase [Patellaria atrata CBS 101060]
MAIFGSGKPKELNGVKKRRNSTDRLSKRFSTFSIRSVPASQNETKGKEELLQPYNGWQNDIGFNNDYEQRTQIELAVQGNIPAYAAGTLYRTGPGGYKVPTANGTVFEKSHWFDGNNQVHRFEIIAPSEPNSPVKVFYNSRHTVDEQLEKIRRTGTLEGFSFAQKRDPCQSYFKKVMSTFKVASGPLVYNKSDANIGVTLSPNAPGITSPSDEPSGHSSGIQTLHLRTDASSFARIDPSTLEPIGITNQRVLHPLLKGPLAAAHAKSDPQTGDVYNFNLEFGGSSTYRVFRTLTSTGETEILASITAPPAYLHSILLTENYVLLCIWGSHFSAGGLSVLWYRNILDAIGPWDSSRDAMWYVIDRRHGKGLVATYTTPAFFCFHTVNAWEEKGKDGINIVAELVAYDNLDILHRFYYNQLLSTTPGALQFVGVKGDSTRPSFRRFRLPAVPSSTTVTAAHTIQDTKAVAGKPRTAEILYSTSIRWTPELPNINPAFLTRPHRYTYGVLDRGISTFVDALVKFDSQYPNEQERHLIWSENGQSPGEPVFIRDPGAEDEDAGVLLSVVLNGYRGKSYLLCLDARTMKEVGRADCEGPIGFGFHGVHVQEGKRALIL